MFTSIKPENYFPLHKKYTSFSVEPQLGLESKKLRQSERSRRLFQAIQAFLVCSGHPSTSLRVTLRFIVKALQMCPNFIMFIIIIRVISSSFISLETFLCRTTHQSFQAASAKKS